MLQHPKYTSKNTNGAPHEVRNSGGATMELEQQRYPYGSELIEYHREGLEEWKDAIMELNETLNKEDPPEIMLKQE
nr:hypothetical protein CFP56_59155 [Quercus suber]